MGASPEQVRRVDSVTEAACCVTWRTGTEEWQAGVDPKDRQCHVRLAVFALDEGAVSACLDAESVGGKPLAERRRGGLSSLNSVSRLAVGCERPRTQVHRQGCARHPGLDAALASDWAGTARHTIEFEASEKIHGRESVPISAKRLPPPGFGEESCSAGGCVSAPSVDQMVNDPTRS